MKETNRTLQKGHSPTDPYTYFTLGIIKMFDIEAAWAHMCSRSFGSCYKSATSLVEGDYYSLSTCSLSA
jgi:hypothetical protein